VFTQTSSVFRGDSEALGEASREMGGFGLTYNLYAPIPSAAMACSVQRTQSEIINENPREKVIVLDLARRAALATFSTGPERIVWPYDEDALWCADRHPVMYERPCDYEDNGTKAWKIV